MTMKFLAALHERATALTAADSRGELSIEQQHQLAGILGTLEEIVDIAGDPPSSRVIPATSAQMAGMVAPFSHAATPGAGFTARMFGPVRSVSTPFASAGDFLRAAANNIHDPRLFVNATGQSEGVAEDGGFAVPSQFSAVLLDKAAESSLFLSRANALPGTSNQITLPAWDTDRSSAKRGNLTAVWLEEAASATV